MTEVDRSTPSTWAVVGAILAVGMFLLLLLYLGLSRYFNAQELKTLVDGAEAAGQTYSVIIYNGLTGRYSFKAG
ncbi:hypothetical protein [Corynebacterium sanguinis]|uniref:Uncharacterized protein n=1 Tax=Corynebacterium sanguinis TaxID=2594913 RepID=A0A6C1TZK4_9CORY|nr:hypothetical protein [Corynebacterium sanguinis]TVS30042.1 hypothetical protein EKI59_01745 [Corynebacterium sanguinis]